MIQKYNKAHKQLDYKWSKERLMNEYLDLSVQYQGNLKLPESCSIISNRPELKREGLRMRHCINEYWEKILNKDCFVIHMNDPEPLTIMISRFKDTKYFVIKDAAGMENSMPEYEALGCIGRTIAEESNQQFFRDNAFNSEICMSSSLEIQEILDSL